MVEVPAIDAGALVTSSGDHSFELRAACCRLNSESSWSALICDTQQWLQITPSVPRKFVAIATQGRHDRPQSVTMFRVTYTIDGVNWQSVDNAANFPAGRGDSIVRNRFRTPFEAMSVRIHPVQWELYISMRCELYYLLEPTTRTVTHGNIPAIASGLGRVSASTDYDANYRAENCRLDFEPARNVVAGAWSAGTNDLRQWLQISFSEPKRVTSIATRGRSVSATGQYVEEYCLKYTLDGVNWILAFDGKLFSGCAEVTTHTLPQPLNALAIRICPTSWHEHISLRCEVYID